MATGTGNVCRPGKYCSCQTGLQCSQHCVRCVGGAHQWVGKRNKEMKLSSAQEWCQTDRSWGKMLKFDNISSFDMHKVY